MLDVMEQLEARVYLADRDREVRALLRAKEASPAGQSLRAVVAAWLARLGLQVDTEATTRTLSEP
jgi:hypothetical protein